MTHTKLTTKLAAIAGILSVAVVALTTVGVLAYGPERTTYTIENPAKKITFNSITNNPKYGDERNFVSAMPASLWGQDKWSFNELNIDKSGEYLVRMYVHNNAHQDLKLIADNTRVFTSIPTKNATEINIGGAIEASNADPARIWDSVVLKSSKMFNVSYVAGSARFYNNVKPQDGFQLSDQIVTTAGTQVGYNQMDGKLQGCYQYAGYVVYKVKIDVLESAKFTINKQVRKMGEKAWQRTIAVKPGERYQYQLMYQNIGDINQTGVILKDFLPKNVTAVSGSVKIMNANNPQGKALDDASGAYLTDGRGLNIGDYTPKSNAYVLFDATAPTQDKLANCGANLYRNNLIVYTPNGNLSDFADIVVNKECAPIETPEHLLKCEVLKVDKVSNTEFKFTTNVAQKNVDVKDITYVVTDKDGKEIFKQNAKNELTYNQNTPGTYKVKATINATVAGENKQVSSVACETEITVDETEATPAELPKTGPVEALVSVISIMAITTAIVYYYRSQQELKAADLDK